MERITKRDLTGMLDRATRAGRECGAIGTDQILRVFVPWSIATIGLTGGELGSGVRPIIEYGGTTRELYNRAYALAVAWEMVA